MSSEWRLRFMSWNVHGLKTNNDSRKKKISAIKEQNCDVVFLQETHLCKREVLKVLDDYKSFYTTKESVSAGVAILIKTSICEGTVCTTEKDPAGCYILVKCTLYGQLFTLLSVYNCHTDINPFLTLKSVLEKHAEGILLIGGDFNVALNPYLDTVSTKKNINHLHFRPIVKELMTSFHLVDVWRRLHPKDRQYSYQQQSRLDYIFVPEESVQYIEECDILYETQSDHFPVVCKIMLKETKNLELFLIIFKEEETKDALSLQKSVVDKWISCKYKYWSNHDLNVNSDTPQMISANEVNGAIQSLIVNDVKRPDGLPVSFYKSYSGDLISCLCAYYNNILEQPTNITEAFNEAIKVSETHYIFNVDYLILATIMARWLNEHLQSHTTDHTVGNNTDSVLLTFKMQPIKVKWSVLQEVLDKEQDKQRTKPHVWDRFRVDVVQMMLYNSPSGKRKSLLWGCPLSPVLMTWYLKHVANKLIENVNDPKPSIHISRENVIIKFSKEFDQCLLDTLKDKYKNVDCTILKESDSLHNWEELKSSLGNEI